MIHLIFCERRGLLHSMLQYVYQYNVLDYIIPTYVHIFILKYWQYGPLAIGQGE